jgi:glyceraldehyde 3-phosphate dehydrogenase
MKKIAINGFGRIGRLAFRQLMGSDEYEVVAINDFSSPEELAYLLKYDTAHRTWGEDSISYNDEGIIFDGKLTKCYKIDNPLNYPWEEHQVDCVLECTGAFTKLEKALVHLDQGAKHVLISAPGSGNMKTVVYGVNHDILDGTESIISAASCTTNCLAPVVKVLDEYIGIESGFMTTVHAYTNDQATQDGAHSKGIHARRGRSAAENIVPASTGAASALGEVIPNLKGKLDGTAFRVPVVNGSAIDLSLMLKREVTADEINSIIALNSNQVLKITMDPIVSSDIIGNPCGALVDGSCTTVLDYDRRHVKVVAWYDNEYGYTAQMLRTMEVLLEKKGY